jgi:hypothetical protein
MDRPDCHAQTRRVVSVYLASLADAAPPPRCPGVSSCAMRSALQMMCRIAQNDGTIRYGLRASKLAELCEYGVATTIHRAECYLIEHGYIERVRKGGGRLSTRWRIVVDKLAPADAKPPEPAQPERVNAPERPQHRRPHWPRRPSFSQPSSPAVTTICSDHGCDGGTLANGAPRCPQCRRHRGPP